MGSKHLLFQPIPLLCRDYGWQRFESGRELWKRRQRYLETLKMALDKAVKALIIRKILLNRNLLSKKKR